MAYATTRFAAQGYHPTSVAEIVDGLGVGKGVFYWYFTSKEELFEEILRDAQQDVRRYQAQAIGDEPDAIRRIELGIRASLDWFDKHRDLYHLFQFAVTEHASSLSCGARRTSRSTTSCVTSRTHSPTVASPTATRWRSPTP